MLTKLILTCLLLTGCSPLHFTANTLLVADWSQTRHIAISDDHIETNPVLGAYPTTRQVNTYFITSLALYNATYYLTPEEHREKIAAFVSGFQLAFVYGNINAGVKFKW